MKQTSNEIKAQEFLKLPFTTRKFLIDVLEPEHGFFAEEDDCVSSPKRRLSVDSAGECTAKIAEATGSGVGVGADGGPGATPEGGSATAGLHPLATIKK
jgi:hypothetical protein